MITCRVCKQEKERAKGQHSNVCGPCWQEYLRDYRRKNADRLREQDREEYMLKRKDPEWVKSEQRRGREYWHNLRREVFMAYGGFRCRCCGETEEKFLSIDHINNDGAEHRRELGYNSGNGKGASSKTLKWLKDNGFPSGFQVLCMNCNVGKARNGGVCPHQLKPREFGERPERIIPSQAELVTWIDGKYTVLKV